MAGPISIFLEQCSAEHLSKREELSTTFSRAGFHVLPQDGLFTAPDDLQHCISSNLKSANLSVHILFNEKGPLYDPANSIAKYQFNHAKEFMAANLGFKIVVWLAPGTDQQTAEPEQKDYINQVRNSLGKGMVFSNASSALQLVEDIRSLMEKKEEVHIEDWRGPMHQTDDVLVIGVKI